MLAFPSAPRTRAAPIALKFVWPLWAPSLTLLVRCLVLNSWLFQISQNPPCTLPVHDVIHIPGNILSLGILFWHLWTTHPPRVRVNTCAQVWTQLTHVLSRRVLSLTKTKGKIYKTKSLGHYITLTLLFWHK